MNSPWGKPQLGTATITCFEAVLSASENAVKTEIWIADRTYVLLIAIIKQAPLPESIRVTVCVHNLVGV